MRSRFQSSSQPIRDLRNGATVAHEALIRFPDFLGLPGTGTVLREAASTLRKHIGSGASDNLVNLVHPGGDEFAFTAAIEGVEQRLWAASLEFSERARSLYRRRDLDNGSISSTDRQGVERSFGLLSISTGIVLWRGEPGCDYHRLVSIAAEVRKAAKSVDGPSVAVNRRDLNPSGNSGAFRRPARTS